MATTIDRKGKTVAVKNLQTGEETLLLYDKLVIGTGVFNGISSTEAKDLMENE